jgi:tetratricopeptide (TPR) repeat protein
MKTGGIAVVLGLATLATLAPCRAGAGTSLQVPVGARAIAMGGAFSAISDDATAIYWNPAGLPWIGHQEIGVSHADLYNSGINDNFASFILPLSRNQAAAADWYDSGFNDNELDFGESRIDLSYGHRFGSKLSAGLTGKYLNRNTNLDGSSVRRGTGAGLDLGLLYHPFGSLRLSAVAQDVFDTKITYSSGDGTVVAFPRTTKLGAAYSPIANATVAVDVDDRLHVGAEYRPIEPIALRAGVVNDPSGTDGSIPSFGVGLKWSVFRFDYALVDHPVLGTTSHFGLSLGFNFNPSQIRIEKVEARDIYSSLYKTYASQPFGSVRIRDLEDSPITARVRIFMPELMKEPSEQDVVLRPRSTQEIPLTVVLPDRVIAREGDRPVQVQVSATYQSQRLPRTEKATGRCVAYGPGAIDWSQGVAQAAAFVTTRDPSVDAVARSAVRAIGPGTSTSGNRNLDFTAAIFDAVGTLGVTYVPDPNNPYSTISGTPKAVDTISYPRETLAKRSGDCDDTSVLMAALLGNVGIRTKFVDVPGHIFLLVNTDIHERNRLALGLEESRYVIDDDEVWIPLETTELSKGFVEAWRIGSENYASWAARGHVQLVDVAGSQERYEPGDLPGAPIVPTLDLSRVEARVGADLTQVASWRESFLASRYGGVRSNLEATPTALNELAHVYFLAGHSDQARESLERALALDPASPRTHNNLGAALASQGDLDGATREFRAATAGEASDAGPWLNLGLTLYAAGDSVGAEAPMARGAELSGGYQGACSLLGLVPDEDVNREGTRKMSAEEARALLKAAIRRVPRPAAGASTAAPRPVKARTWTSRMAGGRSSERAELADLLYWKP